MSRDGREHTLYWVERGDSCIHAINCIFNNTDYPAWVAADAEPARVAVIPALVYRELFETEPAVQRFTINIMSSRVLHLMTMLTQAVSFGVEARLAALLLRKMDDNGTVPMSQEVLAGHLGTAREVVTRSLRSLVAQNMVATRRGAVEVLNAESLSSLISEPTNG